MTAVHGRRLWKNCRAPAGFGLLDLMLPDIDGFGVCEILRSTETTATIPIVITSVWRRPDPVVWDEIWAFDYLANRSARTSWSIGCSARWPRRFRGGGAEGRETECAPDQSGAKWRCESGRCLGTRGRSAGDSEAAATSAT